MKFRHNKKRNIGIVYGLLSKEFIRRSGDTDTGADEVLGIIREHFTPNSPLMAELAIYRDLVDAISTPGVSGKVLEKVLYEAKMAHRSQVVPAKAEEAKTKLIDRINKTLGQDFWNTHIDNFKTYAQIYQILQPEGTGTMTERILAEEAFLASPTTFRLDESVSANKVVELAFQNFENTYKSQLLPEQYSILCEHARIPEDDGVRWNSVMATSLANVRRTLNEAMALEDVHYQMVINEAITALNKYADQPIEERDLMTLMQLQEAAHVLREELKKGSAR
jgi:hypothetical protein